MVIENLAPLRSKHPRLKPVIDRIFPLQDIAAAFRHYESQKHFGKVCLEL